MTKKNTSKTIQDLALQVLEVFGDLNEEQLNEQLVALATTVEFDIKAEKLSEQQYQTCEQCLMLLKQGTVETYNQAVEWINSDGKIVPAQPKDMTPTVKHEAIEPLTSNLDMDQVAAIAAQDAVLSIQRLAAHREEKLMGDIQVYDHIHDHCVQTILASEQYKEVQQQARKNAHNSLDEHRHAVAQEVNAYLKKHSAQSLINGVLNELSKND